MSNLPKCIYIFTGKRKSGKDYLTDILYKKLDPKQAVILKLSAPIKKLHAEQNGLEYECLLSSSIFKEAHRKNMIEWSQQLREKDYGCFCKEAISMSKAENYPFWIVSDARRKTDIKWFKENYSTAKIKTFRIICPDSIREQRGWIFTEGIDNEETECGLDEYAEWDQIIINDNTYDISRVIDEMVQEVKQLILCNNEKALPHLINKNS